METDGQRDARAVDNAVKDVAADVVGAEPVLGAGRGKLVVEVLIVVALGGDNVGKQGHGDEQQQTDEAQQGNPVLAKAAPDFTELAFAHIVVVLCAVFLHRGGAGFEDVLFEGDSVIH